MLNIQRYEKELQRILFPEYIFKIEWNKDTGYLFTKHQEDEQWVKQGELITLLKSLRKYGKPRIRRQEEF